MHRKRVNIEPEVQEVVITEHTRRLALEVYRILKLGAFFLPVKNSTAERWCFSPF
jgi:hypothetical protein